MNVSQIKTSSMSSRITDLVVLTASFLIFSLVSGFSSLMEIFSGLVCYVTIVFMCLRLCKRIMFYHSYGSMRVFNVLLGNFCGFFLGGSVVIILGLIMTTFQIGFLMVIFPSIMAFFVLGTLSPMVKSSHRDIIHH